MNYKAGTLSIDACLDVLGACAVERDLDIGDTIEKAQSELSAMKNYITALEKLIEEAKDEYVECGNCGIQNIPEDWIRKVNNLLKECENGNT